MSTVATILILSIFTVFVETLILPAPPNDYISALRLALTTVITVAVLYYFLREKSDNL